MPTVGVSDTIHEAINYTFEDGGFQPELANK